jgi:hypothetical protein
MIAPWRGIALELIQLLVAGEHNAKLNFLSNKLNVLNNARTILRRPRMCSAIVPQ